MTDPFAPTPPTRTVTRVSVAVLVGFLGAVLIWLATPYNNFVMGNSFIADDYLPAAVVFLVMLLVLVINPLLRWAKPRLALNTQQLAIIMGIWLVACVIPGHGTLRYLPYMLTKPPVVASTDQNLAKQFEEMDLPPELFPDRVGFGNRPLASENMINELPAGAEIPWENWTGPLMSWGIFLLAAWAMMIGLGMIVTPQWRRNERLAYPLLSVQQALIEDPDQGKLFNNLLRSRGFWVGVATVFFIHLTVGGNTYFPDGIPAFPIKWNLTELFAEEPFRHIPGHIRSAQIYFAFLGVAFFMPTRISFSIWFIMIAYGVYRMVGFGYFPPFADQQMDNHRDGAMFAITLFVLWIGRDHWRAVFASLFSFKRGEEHDRNRTAGLLFIIGVLGLTAWLLWVGVQWPWAIALVAFAFMVALVISRIVAETGMPFVRLYGEPLGFMKMFPVAWIGPVSLYFGAIIGIFFPMGSRVNASAMSVQAFALDETARPRHNLRLGLLFLGVLVAGLLISGWAHMQAGYHHGGTIDGREQPLSAWGVNRLDPAGKALGELERGQFSQPPQNQWLHVGFGAALAAALYWACLVMPTWPIHPVGMLLIETHYGRTAWASIMFGWMLKVLLVRFGGSRVLKMAKPLFIGVIVGEILAAIFWMLIPAILVALGKPYEVVNVLPR